MSEPVAPLAEEATATIAPRRLAAVLAWLRVRAGDDRGQATLEWAMLGLVFVAVIVLVGQLTTGFVTDAIQAIRDQIGL